MITSSVRLNNLFLDTQLMVTSPDYRNLKHRYF